jgi:hypothetical protein
MRRVARNVERVREALDGLGYRFEAEDAVVVRPQADAERLLGEIEAVVGPVPLSLTAWIGEVGGVNLNGTHPDWVFEYTDPLVVECDSEASSRTISAGTRVVGSNWRERLGCRCTSHRTTCTRRVSGGEPYGIELPDGGADAPWRNDDLHVGATFVGYLRSALLDWAGFPGLGAARAGFRPVAAAIPGRVEAAGRWARALLRRLPRQGVGGRRRRRLCCVTSRFMTYSDIALLATAVGGLKRASRVPNRSLVPTRAQVAGSVANPPKRVRSRARGRPQNEEDRVAARSSFCSFLAQTVLREERLDMRWPPTLPHAGRIDNPCRYEDRPVRHNLLRR